MTVHYDVSYSRQLMDQYVHHDICRCCYKSSSVTLKLGTALFIHLLASDSCAYE